MARAGSERNFGENGMGLWREQGMLQNQVGGKIVKFDMS
jgi:hypothetical protein